MRTIIIIALALLTGCTGLPNTGTVPIYWERLDTQEQVIQACGPDNLIGMRGSAGRVQNGKRPDQDVLGCFRQLANGACLITTTKMQSKFGDERAEINRIDGKLFMTVGHEMAHCFTGLFHQ